MLTCHPGPLNLLLENSTRGLSLSKKMRGLHSLQQHETCRLQGLSRARKTKEIGCLTGQQFIFIMSMQCKNYGCDLDSLIHPQQILILHCNPCNTNFFHNLAACSVPPLLYVTGKQPEYFPQELEDWYLVCGQLVGALTARL